MELLLPFTPFIVAALLLGGMLLVAQYVLISRRPDLGSEARLPRQLILFILTLASIIVLVVLSPVAESTRNQILGLIGLLTSGVIAVSATAFVTNFMAAIMLRVTQPFDVGDFITVGENFGKVAERGLFDTEIQTEFGDLIAVPNATFITSPVKVIDKDGTIISTTLSLGYDVHHRQIEELLKRAAEHVGLTDAYVHVIKLGDFSVSYRVSGFLGEAKTLLTCRSNLNLAVLDTLHEAGVEIVSPTFARHIQHSGDDPVIPLKTKHKRAKAGLAAEDVAFAKANQAQALELKKQEIQEQIAEFAEKLRELVGEEKEQMQEKIKVLELQLQEANGAENGN